MIVNISFLYYLLVIYKFKAHLLIYLSNKECIYVISLVINTKSHNYLLEYVF